MSETKTHIIIRALKVLGWTVISLAVLLTAVRFSLKTTVVHNFAKKQIVSIAGKNLNGTLSIGNIEGDLWNDFTVSEIVITQKDTLLQLDTLDIQYNIRRLLGRTFQAHGIRLSGFHAYISETDEKQFNIQQLIKQDTSAIKDDPAGAFNIDIRRFEIENASVLVHSPSYLPDSTLSVKSLKASGGFSYFGELSASLSSLSFQLIEGRLPEPVAFQTAGSYSNKEITLNQLVIETGRSLLNARGFTSFRDSVFDAEAEALPFSLQDITPYLDGEFPENQLQLSLKAGGHLDSLHIEISAEGEGFEDLLLISDLSLSGTPTLKKFGLRGQHLDLAYFTNNSVDAEVGYFQFTVQGRLNEDLPSADITWGFTLNQIRYETYEFEILFGSGTIKNQTLLGNLQVGDGQDEIIAYPEIWNLFAEKPSWRLPVHLSNINLAWWLRNPELSSDISFHFIAEGKGFELSKEPWKYSIHKPFKPVRRAQALRSRLSKSKTINPMLVVDTMTVAGQKFSDLYINGSMSIDSLKADGFLQLIDNKVSFSTSLANYLQDNPSYSYNLQTRGFDMAEVSGYEELSTSLNLLVNGTGQYFDPEKLRLNAELLIDSSFVNEAYFDHAGITAGLENNILTIPDGELISDVIEGTFSGRRNLDDPADSDNNFALDMELKNIQPLASLAGVNTLKATGNITGNITEIIENELLFDGNIQLQDIQYDTLFSAAAIEGETKISIRDEYGYDLSLDIAEPTFSNFPLQDLEFEVVGISKLDSLTGKFNLNIASDGAGQISQSGNYALNTDSLSAEIIWQTFDFQTPARLLSLQAPFKLNYKNSAIQTDTLQLRSDGGTYLYLAIPFADSLRQQLWASGHDFDFGVIQEIIFDERFVDGVLSGNLNFSNTPGELTGDGLFTISNLSYKGTDIDLMDLEFNILSERLSANLRLMMNGEEKVSGNLDIPFVAADPYTLDDSFFNEPIAGQLVINPVQLSDFENLLQTFQINETDGILSFNGQLSGTAGQPDFEGDFNLGQPSLSGIKIDSAFARFRYHHLEEKLTALAEINAKGQRAASISTELPIRVDFTTFQLHMPDETDSLTINLLTDNFNISVFNDFLDMQYLARLKGVLNAQIDITGTTNNLVPTGFLKLDAAEVSVPIAGIKLSKINSEFSFTETGLQLTRLTANSGSGSFTANGAIDMEGIRPTNLDITAKANRFRLANTSNYNLTIDLNSRLTGKPTQPKASGLLTIKNGFVYLQEFGERSVETVELEDEETSSFSPYDSLAIDMQFKIERNFLVRNRRYLDLEIALTGELDAQKQTNAELALFGTLNANRGYVRPLGKLFTLDEGIFTFSGPLDEPDLYVKTSYIPRSSQKQGDPIILYYIIEGNAKEPEYRFESEPQMEQENIICYTLFNKPCFALESWQKVVSSSGGSSPTDLLVDVLLGEVETLATQELGIDVVQINNTRSSSGGGTSIKTGWYLNRRTFFAIVNEISGTTPKTLFILEYLLKDNLDLIITQGDDNRQGIDIRWQYDY